MKKRLRLPSPSLVISLVALFLALGGTAMAAAGVGLVKIADAKSPKHVARVDRHGRLEVGDGKGPLTVDGNVKVDNGAAPLTVGGNVKVDNGAAPLTVAGNVKVDNGAAPLTVGGNVKVDNGSGPLTVDGTVNAQPAPPSTYLHFTTFAITSTRGCLQIAQPPAGMAMVVREVRIDVFNVSTTGPDQDLVIYDDATCTNQVGDVNPATVGETTLPFDPGLGIAAGSGLSARATGSVQAETYVDAFAVPTSAVPAVAHVARHRSHQ